MQEGWVQGRQLLCTHYIKMANSKLTQAEKKARTEIILAICLVVFGCALVAAGFSYEPPAEIHPSVLTAFGEILSFAGAVIGIDYSYKKSELRHRDGSRDEKDA